MGRYIVSKKKRRTLPLEYKRNESIVDIDLSYQPCRFVESLRRYGYCKGIKK